MVLGKLDELRALGRLSSFLARLSHQPDVVQPDPLLRERVGLRTAAGTLFDLFEPRASSGDPLVALHGCTLNGKDDARLQHFSRCLARAGRSVYVPTLPALAEARWSAQDVEVLVELVDEIHARSGQPVDLIGFSFSSSYALVGAARPHIADKVRTLLGFGAYCSFPETYRLMIESYSRSQVPDDEWDDHIYLHLITAYRQRQRLGLAPELIEQMERLLRDYCHPATAEEKRAFFEHKLRGLDALKVEREHLDWSVLEALSPAGKLGGLRCPVYLLHDPSDPLVPPGQARLLLDELRERSGAPEQRLLFTSMLQHVSLADVFNLGEVRRLLASLLPLIGRQV
jgi:pimeloyl-ACP methyl ester carboxylesterase